VCFNCHNITPASFQLPGGTLYQAGNAAANYVVPISGFSRGGHGDSNINDGAWFEDVADGWSVPLGCTACHDETTDHFPVASSDIFRIGTVNTVDASQTTVTNLCIGCHPATQTNINGEVFAFLEPPKHPSDHYSAWGGGTSDTLVTEGAMSVYSTHDPANVPGIGSHIDQYVDHWQYWGPPATGDTGDDYTPFLPLGDTLDSNPSFDNNIISNDRVTCVTCHNPHGTDLFVSGETPGSGSTVSQIPANKMLRLRDQDDELCSACHR